MSASTTEYGWGGNPVKVTETANGVTRTATNTFGDVSVPRRRSRRRRSPGPPQGSRMARSPAGQ
ncbi:YD repeat-containing protein [Streptomyces venezuelae]|uniref:hypothetical protein n=1 Tax=Streptomyces gardneri TaxID=66892 RepID=UPI0006BC7438|nr:hypothetical protein [Streptomyces gardneri]ALO05765.1 YD repeat-containing protein [Streptomyces venezuelae]QPK43322.1 hypothetical protein H4W23_00795 [Streptomyces gardneri]WRK34547.1 hypothetical protein U0M97_00790 [Streptomyces venezuelae]CUM44040.1 hypothetical protein BN2537_17045 [Streptomyces venezuelae]